MQVVNVKAAQNAGKIRAYFDVITEDGFVIKDFKLVEGSNGMFVGVPSTPDKNKKYWDKVTVPGNLKDDLLKLALMEYRSIEGAPPAAAAKTQSSTDQDPF